MTVSRRGKRGTRAGHMIPESRNRRVVRNAGLKNVSKKFDMRPTGKRQTREQWVIRVATNIVGTKAGKDFVAADDTVSDILLALLDAGGFNWEEDEIIHFCRKKALHIVQRYLGRQERPECEFVTADNDKFNLADIKWTQHPTQGAYVDARRAYRCLQAIPNPHRSALEILCGGGNPIEVAEELGLTPWEAIKMIKEARDYVDRVDPIEGVA